MLDKEQLANLFDHLGIPSQGQALVREARLKAPIREVQSRGSNVVTIFTSRKMACEIRTESRHIEFAGALNHEFDPTVLEFYPQPCVLRLRLVDEATSEEHNIQHTPDFLVLRANGITLEEWKSEEKLSKLAQRYPYRYQRDNDGNWYSPQIEQQLAEQGIAYRIRTDRSIARMRVENLLHLADYYHPGAEPCDLQDLKRLQNALQLEGMLFLADLISPKYNFKADFLFKAIADDLVVTDLDNEPLTNVHRCRLYRDKTYLQFTQKMEKPVGDVVGKNSFTLELAVGTRFQYGEQQLEIVLVDAKDVVCRSDQGNTVTLTHEWLIQAHESQQVKILHSGERAVALNFSQYSDEELKQALRRQKVLQSPDKIVSERTLRDWRARQKIAEANGANATLALIPNTKNRGNRTARLSDEQEALLDKIIREKWKTSEAINYKTLHRWVQNEFNAAGFRSPSYPTIIGRVKAQSDTQDVRLRHGKRRAYQQDEFVSVLYADTPINGSRAFQYVHIDHTQSDIALISSQTGKSLGRPWLSFAVDAFTRRIIGFYLTFDPPSYLSVMMVMRDIVRRFQRLPEMIVVDNGRDLTSEAFKSFLQVMGVHLRLRPAGQPRAGAIMERVFGTAHTQYIHNLAGNTKATKQVRMTSRSHLPENLAQWTLESLYSGLEYWATKYYDNEPHVALGCSPREMFERSFSQSGQRKHKRVIWNEDFRIATCPPADRGGLRQVNHQRGVKIHDQYFWNPVFRDPKISGQKLMVRTDPWDASTVYVRVDNQWVKAQCKNFISLGQLTDLERRAITEEYLSKGGKPLNDELAAQRLREFMQVFTPEGALETFFGRQQENKALYNTLGMSVINPVAPVLDRMNLASLEKTANLMTDINLSSAQPEPTPYQEAIDPIDLPDFDTF